MKYPNPGRVADEAKLLKEKVPTIKELNKADAKTPADMKKKPKKRTCPGCTTPSTCTAQGKCRVSGRAI